MKNTISTGVEYDFYNYFNYVYELKTANPIYIGITSKMLKSAINIYINKGTMWADGDSIDRERVLGLLIILHGSTIQYNRKAGN